MPNSPGNTPGPYPEASRPAPARFNPQQLINSRLAISLAYTLARAVPPRLSASLVGSIASWISHRKSWEMVQAVRLNHWVISGGTLTGPELDRAAAATFAHSGRCLYDLYHRPGYIDRLAETSPAIQQLVQRNLSGDLGMVIVGLHMSNFDLVVRWIGSLGANALGIGLPQMEGGYQLQNDMRRRVGFEILPASRQAVRQAVAFLQSGGTVLTGIDRPISGSHYQPCFFGRPASLPVLHISLALQAHVPVIVAGVEQQPDGRYLTWASAPIAMQPGPNRHAEIISNAEAVLSLCEVHIRKNPHQWLMFYPVWPEAFSSLPG